METVRGWAVMMVRTLWVRSADAWDRSVPV